MDTYGGVWCNLKGGVARIEMYKKYIFPKPHVHTTQHRGSHSMSLLSRTTVLPLTLSVFLRPFMDEAKPIGRLTAGLGRNKKTRIQLGLSSLCGGDWKKKKKKKKKKRRQGWANTGDKSDSTAGGVILSYTHWTHTKQIAVSLDCALERVSKIIFCFHI